MDTKNLAQLEEIIDQYLTDIVQDGLAEYDLYFAPQLAKRMALAAAQVYDISFEVQVFATENEMEIG